MGKFVFAVQFALALPSADKFWWAQEVGVGLGVIVRGGSSQGGQKATGPCLLGSLRNVRPERDSGGKNRFDVRRSVRFVP